MGELHSVPAPWGSLTCVSHRADAVGTRAGARHWRWTGDPPSGPPAAPASFQEAAGLGEPPPQAARLRVALFRATAAPGPSSPLSLLTVGLHPPTGFSSCRTGPHCPQTLPSGLPGPRLLQRTPLPCGHAGRVQPVSCPLLYKTGCHERGRAVSPSWGHRHRTPTPPTSPPAPNSGFLLPSPANSSKIW